MDLDNLTIGDAKRLAAMFPSEKQPAFDNGMLGKYVIVRCRDAGVHAGVLTGHHGREALLTEARRLWYWKPADDQKYLSGVAVAGLDEASKIGAPIDVHLTETCEIIRCSEKAARSIREAPTDER